MNITKVNSDNRGEIYSLKVGNKEVVLVSFNKDISRGGHFHKVSQWHTCLLGEFKVKLFDIELNHEEEVSLKEGESLLIEPGIVHLFTAKGEALLAESRQGGYEATDYEPYRKLARPK